MPWLVVNYPPYFISTRYNAHLSIIISIIMDPATLIMLLGMPGVYLVGCWLVGELSMLQCSVTN